MFKSLYQDTYNCAAWLLRRAIAALYALAFWVCLDQFSALLGERGILPVQNFTEHFSFAKTPSIFHFYYSDSFLIVLCIFALICAAILFFGFLENLHWSFNAVLWFLLWVIYLSIVNVGQTFYGFGWESILLEAGFLAIFLGSKKEFAPILLIFLFRWMLFRIEFGAGLIKIRGDECWRDFTCLDYHHETQPMPGPLTWYFHNLPAWFHKLEVIGNHIVQLIMPWLIFMPQPIAAFAALAMMLTQFWLVLSGNFSWLNWMTILLCLVAIPDSFFPSIFDRIKQAANGITKSLFYASIAVTLLFVVLSYFPVKNMLSPKQAMNASFNPFHLANTYGAFGHVSKKRFEVVLEGTSDEALGANTKWREYQFKGKPSDPMRQPLQFAPYHLRLDWQIWFSAFRPQASEHWFFVFVQKLLEGDEGLVKLLANNPFPEQAPKYIRAKYYLYEFTSPEEKARTGAWWKRTFIREYMPPMHLRKQKKASN